jgi:hypothetical protein
MPALFLNLVEHDFGAEIDELGADCLPAAPDRETDYAAAVRSASTIGVKSDGLGSSAMTA